MTSSTAQTRCEAPDTSSVEFEWNGRHIARNRQQQEQGSSTYILWWPEKTNIDLKELGKTPWVEKNDRKPNSDLCKLCRVFFDTWNTICDSRRWEEEFKEIWQFDTVHHINLHWLKYSAQMGCKLCRLFVSMFEFNMREELSLIDHLDLQGVLSLCRWSEDMSDFPLFWEINLRYRKAKDSEMLGHGEASPKAREDDAYYDQRLRLLLRPQYESKQNVEAVSHSLGMPGGGLRHPKEEELSLGCDADSLMLVRSWLEECLTNHATCIPTQRDQIRKPTRLVKIDDGRIRLCLTSEQHESRLTYTTLSHCWGNLEFLKLLSSNFSDFLEDIPRTSLPKTFRDAIDIAQALGFSFIWIDSLCIVQDDPVDCRHESALMVSVYGFSSLNISATAAADGTAGCFFSTRSCPYPWNNVEVEIDNEARTYHCAYYNLVQINLFKAPLTARAWAMQERLLAPRTLHFAGSQLFWECKGEYACETFPSGILSMYTNGDGGELATRQLWHSWKNIVEVNRLAMTILPGYGGRIFLMIFVGVLIIIIMHWRRSF